MFKHVDGPTFPTLCCSTEEQFQSSGQTQKSVSLWTPPVSINFWVSINLYFNMKSIFRYKGSVDMTKALTPQLFTDKQWHFTLRPASHAVIIELRLNISLTEVMEPCVTALTKSILIHCDRESTPFDHYMFVALQIRWKFLIKCSNNHLFNWRS